METSSAFAEVEHLLPQLTAGERAMLIDKLTRQMQAHGGQLAPGVAGIDSDPEVCGGEARIVRTRIPVWLLEQARRLGKTDSDLLAVYPSLRADDLTHAWAYVATHRDEIDSQIRENEAE